MRSVAGLLLLLLGSSLFGLSLGVILSLSGGGDFIYYGPVSIEGFYSHVVEVESANGTVIVGSGGHGIIGCIVYSPPNTTLILNANMTRPLHVSVSVDSKYRGEATLVPLNNSIVADLVHFEGHGIYVLWVNASVPDWQGVRAGRLAFSLYGPSGGWLPAQSLLAALSGAVLAVAGYRLLSGAALWASMTGLLPVLAGVASLYYGLTGPLPGAISCYWPDHVPPEWNPGESIGLAKLIVARLVSDESPVAGDVSIALLVFSVISVALASTASMEWGLGEFESIIFPSKRLLYAYKVLLPLTLYILLPGLLLVEAHLAVYGSIPGWSIIAALYASASFAGPLLLAAATASLAGLLSRRASVAIVAGVSIALAPILGYTIAPSPSELFARFHVESPLSYVPGADRLGYHSLAGLLPELIIMQAWLIIASLTLLAASFIVFSRWEP